MPHSVSIICLCTKFQKPVNLRNVISFLTLQFLVNYFPPSVIGWRDLANRGLFDVWIVIEYTYIHIFLELKVKNTTGYGYGIHYERLDHKRTLCLWSKSKDRGSRLRPSRSIECNCRSKCNELFLPTNQICLMFVL